MESLSLTKQNNLLIPGKRFLTICLGNKIAINSNNNKNNNNNNLNDCLKEKRININNNSSTQQESSRLGVVTNPSYPYLDELNQIELEAPIKGYLNKLVSRKWFTPLWLNNINSKNSWRTTYCILRANKLYYYQNQLSLGLDKKNCGQINLDYYDVCEPLTTDNDKGPKYSFLIYSSLAAVSSSSKSAQSRHIFSADSAFEMFKWISSIQNAIKDARVNRKGPGRRRQDKLKHGKNPSLDGNKHKTAPSSEGVNFDTDRIEPVSILRCEQKNRPRGPTGRRLPGRANLHSTILNGVNSSSSSRDLTNSTGNLLSINESSSLETSTELTDGSVDTSDETTANHLHKQHSHNNNHHPDHHLHHHLLNNHINNPHHHHHQQRPRTMTTETMETDENDGQKVEEEGNHCDTIDEQSNRRIIGIMNKMKLVEEEDLRKDKIKMVYGFGKKDTSYENNIDKQHNIISQLNETSNHFDNIASRLNGKTMVNGYLSPTIKTLTLSSSPSSITPTTTSPSMKRVYEDSKDLKKHLNALLSNNNQQYQQLTINLGDSTVSIDQSKLTQCLKEICPMLKTGSLLSEGSQVKGSLTDLDPALRSLIKELDSLKGVKKSKARSVQIQGLVDKMAALVDNYSKNVESFDNYNEQVVKLLNSLSTLVSQSTSPMISSTPPQSSSPSSSPKLVTPNTLLYKAPVNRPSSTHC